MLQRLMHGLRQPVPGWGYEAIKINSISYFIRAICHVDYFVLFANSTISKIGHHMELQWKIWVTVMQRDYYIFKADQEQRTLNSLYKEQDELRIVQFCLTGK